MCDTYNYLIMVFDTGIYRIKQAFTLGKLHFLAGPAQ